MFQYRHLYPIMKTDLTITDIMEYYYKTVLHINYINLLIYKYIITNIITI